MLKRQSTYLNTWVLNSFPYRLSFLASLIVRLAEKTGNARNTKGAELPVASYPSNELAGRKLVGFLISAG